MNKLVQILVKQIALTGPITIADYMRTALMHPKYGYYQQQTVFGEQGDFITAPDISQMFGEIIGLYCIERWTALGSPEKFALVELGPGRARLMSDILRVTQNHSGFSKALQIHLVEKGSRRKEEQLSLIKDATWHTHIDALPALPTIAVANEFFDALPAHQFMYDGTRWLERRITKNGDTLGYCLTDPSPVLALKDGRLPPPKKGDILELCPEALDISRSLADHFQRVKGTALIIDYGYAGWHFGDTFQAVKDHMFVDPLTTPGQADLTTHVAFDPLLARAKKAGADVFHPSEQGRFLMALGIGKRAQALAKGKPEQIQKQILSELKRLTSPDQMGSLFKVAAFQSTGLSSPPCQSPMSGGKAS